MLVDHGSRDAAFLAIDRRVRERLLAIAGGGVGHVCVPLQGSGTFAVEAMLGTLVPPGGRVLVLVNGAYGRRMATILSRIGRQPVVLETAEDTPAEPGEVARRLARDPALGHVAVVHCETTTGLLNPLADIARVASDHRRELLVDAMSSFGALAVDAAALAATAVAASANKCLEGVPGMGFVIADRARLAAAAGNAPSLSLDLHDQQAAYLATGQWRFTPPTHVIAALDSALEAHAAEGGVAGRGARYARNCAVLVAGMRRLGFRTVLPDALQAPIIVTFDSPDHPEFAFERFYDGLQRRGYVIYPGKLTRRESFRIGCIGQLGEAQMRGVAAAAAETLAEMGVTLAG